MNWRSDFYKVNGKVARNLGLSCFYSQKLLIFLKQTFFKDSKTIQLNLQKVSVPRTGIDDTFSKQVLVPVVVYFPAASFVVMSQVCFTVECVITSQSVISRISDL